MRFRGYQPNRYLAKLYGGPFDGHEAEVEFPPRKIVVARDNLTRVRIGDYELNPPPWPAKFGVQLYALDGVDRDHVAHYRHRGVQSALHQLHEEAAR